MCKGSCTAILLTRPPLHHGYCAAVSQLGDEELDPAQAYLALPVAHKYAFKQLISKCVEAATAACASGAEASCDAHAAKHPTLLEWLALADHLR